MWKVEGKRPEVVEVGEKQQDEVRERSSPARSCGANIGSTSAACACRPPVGWERCPLLVVDCEHGTVEEAASQLGHLWGARLKQGLFDNLPVGKLLDQPDCVARVVVNVGL